MYFDRPRDLLRIAPQALLAGSVPPWVSDHLRLSRCVVVRRTARAEPRIPVGVRAPTGISAGLPRVNPNGSKPSPRLPSCCNARFPGSKRIPHRPFMP
jgi:hypothetical protein